MLQLIHFVLGLFYSIFTIVPIVFQIPLYEYIGTFGCYGFWFIQVIDGHAHVIFGFGMAIYRLICFENLLMKSLLKKLLIKRILIAESLAIVFQALTSVMGLELIGWQKSYIVQYCMNMSPLQADIVSEYSQGSILIFGKSLRILKNVMGQAMVIGELLIYIRIISSIWKHDQDAKDKDIITHQAQKQRNHKNVITLYGQAASFLVELTFAIYLLIYHLHIPPENRDPSHVIISYLISNTLVSVTQFLSSHELRSFVFEFCMFD